MGSRGPERKDPKSGRKRTVKQKVPFEVDAWGRQSVNYKPPTPEELTPPPDFYDNPNDWRTEKCGNCGQDIYMKRWVRQKWHKSCKPIKNNMFGIPPDAELPRVGDPAKRKRPGPVCGSKLRRPGPNGEDQYCCMPAGWGTEHLGYGNCKKHLGTTPSQMLSAMKKKIAAEGAKRMLDLYGEPKDVDPITAILDEVRRTVGHVEWLRATIVTMGEDPDDSPHNTTGRKNTKVLHQHTPMGIGPSVWIQMYQQERAHLVRVCQAAVGMGVAERQVKLAEDQGRLIAAVLRATFEDPRLKLTNEQKSLYPQVVREHLLGVPSVDNAGKVSVPASKELLTAESQVLQE